MPLPKKRKETFNEINLSDNENMIQMKHVYMSGQHVYVELPGEMRGKIVCKL